MEQTESTFLRGIWEYKKHDKSNICVSGGKLLGSLSGDGSKYGMSN